MWGVGAIWVICDRNPPNSPTPSPLYDWRPRKHLPTSHPPHLPCPEGPAFKKSGSH